MEHGVEKGGQKRVKVRANAVGESRRVAPLYIPSSFRACLLWATRTVNREVHSPQQCHNYSHTLFCFPTPSSAPFHAVCTTSYAARRLLY